MVFAVVLFVVLLTIAVVLIKTPLLHLNEEDTSGKYQGFYTTITQLDYSYVLYLVTNGKIKEADKYIDDNLNENNLNEVASALSTIYYTLDEKEEKD